MRNALLALRGPIHSPPSSANTSTHTSAPSHSSFVLDLPPQSPPRDPPDDGCYIADTTANDDDDASSSTDGSTSDDNENDNANADDNSADSDSDDTCIRVSRHSSESSDGVSDGEQSHAARRGGDRPSLASKRQLKTDAARAKLLAQLRTRVHAFSEELPKTARDWLQRLFRLPKRCGNDKVAEVLYGILSRTDGVSIGALHLTGISFSRTIRRAPSPLSELWRAFSQDIFSLRRRIRRFQAQQRSAGHEHAGPKTKRRKLHDDSLEKNRGMSPPLRRQSRWHADDVQGEAASSVADSICYDHVEANEDDRYNTDRLHDEEGDGSAAVASAPEAAGHDAPVVARAAASAAAGYDGPTRAPVAVSATAGYDSPAATPAATPEAAGYDGRAATLAATALATTPEAVPGNPMEFAGLLSANGHLASAMQSIEKFQQASAQPPHLSNENVHLADICRLELHWALEQRPHPRDEAYYEVVDELRGVQRLAKESLLVIGQQMSAAKKVLAERLLADLQKAHASVSTFVAAE